MKRLELGPLWDWTMNIFGENYECIKLLKKKGSFAYVRFVVSDMLQDKLSKGLDELLYVVMNGLESEISKQISYGWIVNATVGYQDENSLRLEFNVLVHVNSEYLKFSEDEKGKKLSDFWYKWITCGLSENYGQIAINIYPTCKGDIYETAMENLSIGCLDVDTLTGYADDEKFVNVVAMLCRILSGKQTIFFGGSWKEARRQLGMKECVKNCEIRIIDKEEDRLILPGRYISVDDGTDDGSLTADEMALIEAFVARCEAKKKDKEKF